MGKEFLTSTPCYEIRSSNWEHLACFDNKKDAIKSAVEFALKNNNVEFCVIEKLNWKENIVFTYKCDLRFSFDDSKDFYQSMISLFLEKLNETITWRKKDGH